MTSWINRRSLGAMLLGATLALGLGTTAAIAQANSVKDSGVLRVGVLSDYPPYGFIDANQKVVGFDIDVAQKLADGLGVKLEVVPVTAPNRIPFLLTNKVDAVIAALGITSERLKQIGFANPYNKQSNLLLAAESKSISGLEDLAGVTVGLVRASAQDTLLTDTAPQGTILMRFDDDATTFQALVSGQVEAIAASSTVLEQLEKNFAHLNIKSKFVVRDQPLGVAFRLEDEALKEEANAIIAAALADGSLNALNEQWFGRPLGELPAMPKRAD